MKTSILSASILGLALLSSCDNGVISGPTVADISARVSAWRGRVDSLVIDVRVNSFRGPLRETVKVLDPDQSQITIESLPVGDWVFAAVYYKSDVDTTTTPRKVKATHHRVAVAQGSVTVSYDSDCSCNIVKGDNVDLRLAD